MDTWTGLCVQRWSRNSQFADLQQSANPMRILILFVKRNGESLRLVLALVLILTLNYDSLSRLLQAVAIIYWPPLLCLLKFSVSLFSVAF